LTLGDRGGSIGVNEGSRPAARFERGCERRHSLRERAVVDRLERGDLELEDALAAFEQGVALTRRCAAQLETAEARIEVLMREGGEWVARPFEAESEDTRPDADEEEPS